MVLPLFSLEIVLKRYSHLTAMISAKGGYSIHDEIESAIHKSI